MSEKILGIKVTTKSKKEILQELEKDIKNNKNTIYDATNITKKRRKSVIELFKNIPCNKVCVFIATPYEECLRRNNSRDRKVPEFVIEKAYQSLQIPSKEEGWDEIIVVS